MEMNGLASDSKCVSLLGYLECFDSALHVPCVFEVILLAHTPPTSALKLTGGPHKFTQWFTGIIICIIVVLNSIFL